MPSGPDWSAVINGVVAVLIVAIMIFMAANPELMDKLPSLRPSSAWAYFTHG
jgi:hypothetical protein